MIKNLLALDSYLFCVKMNFYLGILGFVGIMQGFMVLIMILFVKVITKRKIDVNTYYK